MNREAEYQEMITSLRKPRSGKLTAVPRSKDQDAFKRIYDQLYLPVYHFARSFVDIEDAEDITANSFLKLWQSDLDYSILPKVRTWLNVCTRNACLDLLGDKKRDSLRLNDFTYFLNSQLETDQECRIKEKLLSRLYAEVEKLPKQCRRIFKMAYLEKQSSKQIAGRLGISENTVSCHRVKSLKILRNAFRDYTWAIILLFTVLCEFSSLSIVLP